jgi:hypothetical protein
MDTEKLDRAGEALLELRAMAGRVPCFEDRETAVKKLKQLSVIEKELSANAESETEQKLCCQIREVVTAFAYAFLPADPRD